MSNLTRLLLAAALLVSTALSAAPVPRYIRLMNAADCSPRLYWSTAQGWGGTPAFEGQTLDYSRVSQEWVDSHPDGRAATAILTDSAQGDVPITTVPLRFAFNATNMALPLRHGQLGICNHQRVVFDFYVSGDALVFRVVPLSTLTGVN